MAHSVAYVAHCWFRGFTTEREQDDEEKQQRKVGEIED